MQAVLKCETTCGDLCKLALKRLLKHYGIASLVGPTGRTCALAEIAGLAGSLNVTRNICVMRFGQDVPITFPLRVKLAL